MSKFSSLQIGQLNFRKIFVCLIFVWGCSSKTTKQSVSQNQDSNTNQQEFNPNTIPSSTEFIEIDKGTNSIKINSNNKQKKEKPFFDWPVIEARMTRGFLPKGTKRSRRPHKGIDLAAQRGTPILASHDGLIIYAGKDFKGYGKMVMIESNGWATLYAHMDKIVVYEGKKVRQGEVLGALGNTGRSSGPHLHFEIRKLDGPLDPLPFLPAGDALTNDVDNGVEEY